MQHLRQYLPATLFPNQALGQRLFCAYSAERMVGGAGLLARVSGDKALGEGMGALKVEPHNFATRPIKST